MTQRAVDVPGGRLGVIDRGAGPSIVLLHAGIVDARAWESLTPTLLAAGYRVVAYDRRGHGGSTTQDIAFSNRADLIAVLDALGIERACLVGNSAGGQIAIDTAVEHPSRVVAVVTVGANVGGHEPEPTPLEADLFAEMDRLEEGDDAAATVEHDLRVWVDGPGQPSTRVPAAIRELVREMDLPLAAPGRVTGQPIRLDPPAATRLAALSMPVLAVAGLLDVSDVPATALFLEASAPDARAVLLPDVAHMIGLERPQQLGELIVAHLRPLGAWS